MENIESEQFNHVQQQYYRDYTESFKEFLQDVYVSRMVETFFTVGEPDKRLLLL